MTANAGGRRVALVTGATGGIGAATCRRLAATGALVAVTDLDVDAAEALAKEIDGIALPLDVTSTESCGAAVERLEAEAGPVEVLVNNAGIDEFGYFGDTNEQQWDRIIAVNLRGVIAVTHAALPGLRRTGCGRVVNVASVAGRLGGVVQVVYSATKGGVIAFSKALAREEIRHGMTVNSVAPGPVETPLLDDGLKFLGEKRGKAFVENIPMGRAGTADDVARAIEFLASPEAGYLTGVTLPVSGGLDMS